MILPDCYDRPNLEVIAEITQPIWWLDPDWVDSGWWVVVQAEPRPSDLPVREMVIARKVQRSDGVRIIEGLRCHQHFGSP